MALRQMLCLPIQQIRHITTGFRSPLKTNKPMQTPQTVFDELETLALCAREQGYPNAVVSRDEDGYYVIEIPGSSRIFADYKQALKYAANL